FTVTWLASRVTMNVSSPGVPEISVGTHRSSKACNCQRWAGRFPVARGAWLPVRRDLNERSQFFASMFRLQRCGGLRYNGNDIGFGAQTVRRDDAGAGEGFGLAAKTSPAARDSKTSKLSRSFGSKIPSLIHLLCDRLANDPIAARNPPLPC